MSDHQSAVSEVASSVSAIASKTTYVGGATSLFGWIASIDILPWLGFIIALAGFAVNLTFKCLENKRASELHRIKIKEFKCKGGRNEVD